MAEVVIRKVFWTDTERRRFKKIVDYLKTNRTENEAIAFVKSTKKIIAVLLRYPEICRPCTKRKHVRIATLNNNTQLVYHYKPGSNRINILLFWNTNEEHVNLVF